MDVKLGDIRIVLRTARWYPRYNRHNILRIPEKKGVSFSIQATILIPILNHPVQPSRRYPRTRLIIPLHARNSTLPSPELMIHLARLPIPKADPTSTITTCDITPIITNSHIYRVPARVMPSETLLPVLAEPIGGCVYDDLIIAGLKGHGFSGGMRRGRDERVHVGFSDEFDGDVDVEFPCAKGLVVRGGDETAIFIAEGDGVYGSEMVVVFLGHLARAGIVLEDFLIGETGEEFVRVGRVEFYHVRYCGVLEAGGAGACFGVPEFHGPVE